ncbi:hypothetical protein GGF46_003487 [Coemansia sp. RSA 552]|nr:hypothetical protein GGF46_003487 [Coemansia sp. RSA 552]
MATSEVGSETQKMLHTVGVSIVALMEHMRSFEGTDEQEHAFSAPKFKATVKDLGRAIDKEVTYMVIACKAPVRDSEVQTLCPKVGAGFFQLVQQAGRIPKAAGRTYLLAVREAICQSLVSAVRLINSFIQHKVEVPRTTGPAVNYITSSGVFWEHCKELLQVPADNREAAAQTWDAQVGRLVKDAVEELSLSLDEAKDPKSARPQSIESEDDEFSDDSLDDLDDSIPAARLEKGRQIEKLAKLAKHTCDKVALRCIRDSTELDDERTIWLDRLVDLGRPVQCAVDDVIGALSMPDSEEESWEECADLCSTKLRQALSELITLAITFVGDSHLAWFDLCRKQLDAAQEKAAEVVR